MMYSHMSETTRINAILFVRAESDEAARSAQKTIGDFQEVGLNVGITGEYDLFLLVLSQNPEKLGKLVVAIARIPEIEKVLTMVILDNLIPVNWFAELLAANKKD